MNRVFADPSMIFRVALAHMIGPHFAMRVLMMSKSIEDSRRAKVVVVGGSGGLSERYRAVVEERGHELQHFENRVPNGTRRLIGKVAVVFVMVGMVSHALRDQVKGMVADDAPIVYLKSASVSALRHAMATLPGGVSA
jgi:Uncharacterized protein conserved in bacteria (DUF2325)